MSLLESIKERALMTGMFLWVMSANIGINLSEWITKMLGIHNGHLQDGLTVAFMGPLAGPIHFYESVRYGLSLKGQSFIETNIQSA